jgi:GT2 family glycosyltransferase
MTSTNKTIIPISAVIATLDRAESLSRTLDSLLNQDLSPAEFIIVDGSVGDATKDLIFDFEKRVTATALVRWVKAAIRGAASQRNQGVLGATQPFIWFCDDDVLFEPNCVDRLWKAVQSDRQLGGVNAMIINQRYHAPGAISRLMFTLVHGHAEKSFAGKVIGPGVNLLPEDRPDLPEVVPVEWLNTTCALYRSDALPDPPFDLVFTGYSLMEDVTLSLKVARYGWKLANARTARIFHDSQPGEHKSDQVEISQMEFINRYYVMTEVLGRRRAVDLLKFGAFELFQILSTLRVCPRRFPPFLRGKANGLLQLFRKRRH